MSDDHQPMFRRSSIYALRFPFPFGMGVLRDHDESACEGHLSPSAVQVELQTASRASESVVEVVH